MLDIRETDGEVTLRVRVQPRAPRDELVGERAGALVVRISAAPAGGEANDALVRFLSRRLRQPASSIRLVRGAGSRDKVLIIARTTAATVRAALGATAAERGA